MEKKPTTQDVQRLYNKYNLKFPTTPIHNLLWKLLFDKTRSLTDAAFTPIIKDGYMEIGIADKGEKGYSPTGVLFATHNYDEAELICEELNQDVFNIDDKTASDIILSSMSK